MMKLTFTLRPPVPAVNRGSGVVSSSGGRTNSQSGREFTWRTSTNCEARIRILEMSLPPLSNCLGTVVLATERTALTAKNTIVCPTRTETFPCRRTENVRKWHVKDHRASELFSLSNNELQPTRYLKDVFR